MLNLRFVYGAYGGRGHLKAEKQSLSALTVATAAHELKNPVEAMMSLAYLLQQNPSLDDKARSYVQQLKRELEHMRHVLAQTLRGYREPAHQTLVSLSDVLETILRFYDHKIVFKQVQVERRYECGGVMKALSEDLRQVFSNLVVNALEALRLNGRLMVHIYRSREWRVGLAGFRVVIADNGCGILPENCGKIFREVFTTKGEKGTGLGLRVSTNIIHRQGGSIRFRTSAKPGRSGTVFSVFIPARLASDLPMAA